MSLTRVHGPLAPRAPATVNYALDGPAHKLLAHPFPRRVRAVVRTPDGDRTIIDTERAVLLHETALLPRLYVPEDDIDQTAFVPSELSTHCPFKGDATYRSLRVGDREHADALWAYPEPTAAAPWLAGYASLYWDAADAWYDEDEQVHAHLTDPFVRVDVRPTSRHVQVFAGDVLVAESHSPLRLDETGLPTRWYLDPADVVVPAAESATRSHCPYKGEASYRSLSLPDGTTLTDAAWTYPDPLPESLRIAGKVSLLHEDLRTVVDGRPV